MNIWSLFLATVAISVLVVIPLWGFRKFNPERARNVKHAERISDRAIQQRVIEIAAYHPEIAKRTRFDHHPFYLWPHGGVWAYAVCILLGAMPTNNVISMSVVARMTMAICFLIGSTFILTGSLMGTKLGRWDFMHRVREHPTAALLGDDVVLPYRVSIAGLACVAVSMSIYASTSFHSTFGSLGGWLTATLAGASFSMMYVLFRRSQDFERDESTLMAEVWARIERECNESH